LARRGGTIAELDTLVASAAEFTDRDAASDPPESGLNSNPKLPREIVYVQGGELPHVIDDAEDILVKCDAEIFEHSTRPSYLGREDPPKKQIVVNPRRVIFPYGADHLADQWTRYVDFQRYDARSKKWLSINCPDYVAQAYLQRKGRRHLRPLHAVISTPTLRHDGSILDTPGYDPDTALFYDPCGVDYPPIPENPTQKEIAEALATLKHPIRKFPFVPDKDNPNRSASRSVMLSAMLTGVIRPSLTTSPLHGFTSPVAGSGKSKLGNIISIIVMGRTVHAVAETKSTDEFEKRVATALIHGEQIIGFDNCTTAVGGGLLSQALTEPSIAIRAFGTLRDAIVENAALVIANGVNLVFSGEVIRRCLRCAIDPQCENPETREFDFEPLQEVGKTRPQLVVAALTLLRAYVVAGRPAQRFAPLGSLMIGRPGRGQPWCGSRSPIPAKHSRRSGAPTPRCKNMAHCYRHGTPISRTRRHRLTASSMS
jgi:putative DNA primase/helicase